MIQRPLRDVAYDILETLKQTFDDRDISLTQAAYWVLLVGNQLKSKHISNRKSGAYLKIFAGVPILTFSVNNNPNEIKNRKCIALPSNIYDYDMDGGIQYISYYPEIAGCPPRFTKVKFDRTSPAEAEWLYSNPYTAPSAQRPYYYRAGDYLYLLGLECVNPKELEVGIYSTLPSITEVDLDAPFDFPTELDHVLTRQVIDFARFSLMVPGERNNDGTDSVESSTVPTNKMTSVNDPNMATE